MNTIIIYRRHWAVWLFMFIWLPVSGLAQTSAFEMVVEKTDGTELAFRITADYPLLSYQYGGEEGINTIEIQTGEESFISVPCPEIKRLYTREVQIVPADIAITPKAKDGLIYTGSIQDLIIVGSSDTGTILYSLDGETYDTGIPQGTDAKEYTVYYKVIGDEYHSDVPAVSFKVTISPKMVNSPTITLSETSYTYDGQAKEPTVTVKDGETEIPATEYTISYSNNKEIGTATVTITDKEGGNYTVSGSTTFAIKAKDDPDSPTTSEEIKISAAKQLPYCSDQDLDFSSKPELKAYVATGYDKTTGTIWLTRVKDVPANTGFLIMGDAGDYEIPVKDGGSNSYYSNMFKGTLEKITLQTTETIGGKEYTNYYLSNGEQGVGFYKVTKAEGQSLGANRAYLPIPTDIPAVGTAGGTEAIKVSAAGQVPYYSANSLDFTDMPDVKAYTATGYNYKSGTIWLTRVKKVPAETGILIMADKGDYPVPTASVASIYENMFKGSLTASTIQQTETIAGQSYINYYLSKGNYGVGFYKVGADGVSLGANRCYLPIPKQPTAGTRGLDDDPTHFGFQESDEVIGLRVFGSTEGTTGISATLNDEGEMMNDKDIYYNLQGQRVEKLGKGLYIKNGKKVVIRSTTK